MEEQDLEIKRGFGYWEYGESPAFSTFPQALFFLFKENMPNKITSKGGEGGTSASHSPAELLLKRPAHRFLTVQSFMNGGKCEI